MTVHRCPLPERKPEMRAWRCPDCGADYVWSKRMIGREVREGWSGTFGSIGRTRPGSPELDRFDRTWRRLFPLAVVLAVAGAVVSIAVLAGAAVWIWSVIP